MGRMAEHALDNAIAYDPVLVAAPNNLALIAEAVAAAQLEMQNPGFDMVNPHFRNKYASLAAVRDAVIPVFAKHGVALIQDLKTGERSVSVTTHLYHKSGQTLTFGEFTLPVSKPDAQGYGSAATYARRYALMSVAGVVGEPDDDANSATDKPAEPQPIPPPAGFEDWWTQMTDAASAGMGALQACWKQSPKTFTQYTLRHQAAAMDSLKAVAAKAGT